MGPQQSVGSTVESSHVAEQSTHLSRNLKESGRGIEIEIECDLMIGPRWYVWIHHPAPGSSLDALLPVAFHPIEVVQDANLGGRRALHGYGCVAASYTIWISTHSPGVLWCCDGSLIAVRIRTKAMLNLAS